MGHPGLIWPVSQALPSGTLKGIGMPAMIPWTTVAAEEALNLMVMAASEPLGRRQGALVQPLMSRPVIVALDPQSLYGGMALAAAKRPRRMTIEGDMASIFTYFKQIETPM